MRIGFIGTGAITEAMVTGILSDTPLASEVVVSPRNAEVASRLASMFPAVRIAADNQEVADASDILVLAIRPQVAERVVRGLHFTPVRQSLASSLRPIAIALKNGLDRRFASHRQYPCPSSPTATASPRYTHRIRTWHPCSQAWEQPFSAPREMNTTFSPSRVR